MPTQFFIALLTSDCVFLTFRVIRILYCPEINRSNIVSQDFKADGIHKYYRNRRQVLRKYKYLSSPFPLQYKSLSNKKFVIYLIRSPFETIDVKDVLENSPVAETFQNFYSYSFCNIFKTQDLKVTTCVMLFFYWHKKSRKLLQTHLNN